MYHIFELSSFRAPRGDPNPAVYAIARRLAQAAELVLRSLNLLQKHFENNENLNSKQNCFDIFIKKMIFL